ncbi:hypothetical protein [Spirosoma lituiforme]
MNTPDQQPNKPVVASSATVNPHVYKAQSELLKIVDSFVEDDYASYPVEAINTLLYHWLTTSTKKRSKKQLKEVLTVVNFIVKVFDQCKQIEDVKRLMTQVHKDGPAGVSTAP